MKKNNQTIILLENTTDVLKSILSSMLQVSDKNILESIIVAKSAGVGSGVALMGLASLVGTASTGTAISTLSGAALTNASLAWLAGSVFTGTIVIAGVGLASGLVAQKYYTGKIRDIEELSDEEKSIFNIVTTLISVLNVESSKQTTDLEVLKYQLKKLKKEFLIPLKLRIYYSNDDISSKLSPRYKKKWYNNRLNLLEVLDDIDNLEMMPKL